ncbi:hypothetical protein Taro_020603 [Colocasia esculenta]|uniref:Uncharacterized protein n=1 Tax=Colocasia esculenta TaxID=4460 RepID=A0A843V029_COLES|nr:hypothetical protein [Colocasia esculenta]
MTLGLGFVKSIFPKPLHRPRNLQGVLSIKRKHLFEISLRLLCSHPFFAPSCSPTKNLQKPSAKPHPLKKKMASPRAQVSLQLTSHQLQRLAKIPICSGKSVEFSHLSGNLAWVEETLTAMGWTKLCQISEPFVASAVRSFYASLKVSTGNTVVGYVKGTEIIISEEYLVELLDCSNSGHCLNLSGDVPVNTKEKIGLITLRRSHYSLVGKKQNLWYKDSVPECEHEIYPDEPLVSLLTQDIPTSSVHITIPAVPTISDAFVQPPEPIIEQVAQPVIPPEVPSTDAQLPASSSLPEQDAPSETVHEVLKDLRGKRILSEDIPEEHFFEERETSYSPSQFETWPRSQGESSNSLSTILELVRTQQENLSVLHMQVEVIDVKFDSLADEVKQIKDLMLQFVCQQSTPRPAGPAPSQQQEETKEKDQEIQADQQPISDEIHQQQQVSEPQLAVVIYHPAEEQQQQQQESVADQQPAAAAAEEEVSLGKRPLEASLEVHTFKRKVKRRLIKNGNPIHPSPSSRPSSPAPPVINPPEITPAAPSSTAPSASVLEVSIPELQIVSQKSHYLTPQEFVDLYPEEAMRFQEAQSRNHHLKIYTHISLQFHDLFATLFRESQAKYTVMKAFNFERFKLGLHDVSRDQYDMLIRGQRPVIPSLIPSTRFKIKYKSKLSFQRFILLHLPKFHKNHLDLQLSFAESERFTPGQWEKAYPDHHAQCQRMKLTLNEYHSKSLLDLRKHIGLKWEHRYLYYYQAKDAALSLGLHCNITLHEFLSLAVTKKFTPLQIKYVMDPDMASIKRVFYRRRHIKSLKKLPFTSPTYNVDPSKFDHIFPTKELKLWNLIEPFLAKVVLRNPRSLMGQGKSDEHLPYEKLTV